MKKLLLTLLGVVLLAVGGLGVVVATMKPAARPAPDLRVELTPARVERGRYLAHNVLLCMDCHSQLDLERYGTPILPGTLGAGGQCFTQENAGFPGRVCAQNLTSDKETGIGDWSDGELLRALREGVSRDGRALFPMMPYALLRSLSDDDAMAIIAYLRTLPPVKKTREVGHVDFPVSFFIKLGPKPLTERVAGPDPKDRVAVGRYLASSCLECHSPVDDQMQRVAGKEFSGGREFRLNDLRVRSANITFDATGLGGRTKEEFIGMFAAFRGGEAPKVASKDNTMMPWVALAGMTDEDLGAIYDYLATVPKVANAVEKRAPPLLPKPPVAAEPGTGPEGSAPHAPGSP